jgi:hypothetical protein
VSLHLRHSLVWFLELVESIYLSIYLWLYSPLLHLGRFFHFLDLITQSVGLLGRGISVSQGRYYIIIIKMLIIIIYKFLLWWPLHIRLCVVWFGPNWLVIVIDVG